MGALFMNFKKGKKIIKIRNIIIQIVQLITGTAIIASSTSFFLLPNQISAGGFSGIATITYYLFKIPLRNHGTFIKYSFVYNNIY